MTPRICQAAIDVSPAAAMQSGRSRDLDYLENVSESDHRIGSRQLGKFLFKDFRRIFGPSHDELAERLGAFARSTIECLGSSDALYHNFEHHTVSHNSWTQYPARIDVVATD